jgi:FtsZ-interacting cell division protein ZipA
MSNCAIWIVIAILVALVLIVALALVVSRATSRRRHRQAEEIRERAKLETARVERREALADETAAKARAAQAEAEAKAAEAARLQERAASHQSEAATSREELQEQWKRAERIDPKARAESRETGASTATDPDAAGSEEQPTDADAPGQHASANYRDGGSYRSTSG